MRHDQVQTLNLAARRPRRRRARRADGRRAGKEAQRRGRAAGLAVERIDVVLRARHALSRPDPHGGGAAAGDARRRRHRRHAQQRRERRSSAPTRPPSAALLPGIPMRDREPAHGGDRPAAAVRSRRLRARRRGIARAGARWARARCGSTAPGTTPRSATGSTLPVGATIDGPAILEQPDATILIDPGLVGRVDRLGNLHRGAQPHERAGRNRAAPRCSSSTCRTTSCIPTAPMRAAATDERRTSPRCRRGCSRSLDRDARQRRTGRRRPISRSCRARAASR